MKKKQITRTMKSTKVTYLSPNLETKMLEEGEITLMGEYSKPTMLAKAVCEYTGKAGTIVTDSEVIEAVYAISEEDFMSHAKIIERPASQQKGDK